MVVKQQQHQPVVMGIGRPPRSTVTTGITTTTLQPSSSATTTALPSITMSTSCPFSGTEKFHFELKGLIIDVVNGPLNFDIIEAYARESGC
jgi:hypothetical protein